jgi:hypothetical protein
MKHIKNAFNPKTGFTGKLSCYMQHADLKQSWNLCNTNLFVITLSQFKNWS